MNQAVHLKDYLPYPYELLSVNLQFKLAEHRTEVVSELSFKSKKKGDLKSLILFGMGLEEIAISIDGKKLSTNDYDVRDGAYSLQPSKEEFTLKVTNVIAPASNHSLSGLYKSGNILCTQCESEGFRRITLFPDRPDVMTRYEVKLVADKKLYPELLANGNLIEHGDLPNGEHFAIWIDPSKKPSYLFALVAGNLEKIQDNFITMSGRNILLEIYCDKGNREKCFHAMESLKKSMRWDEEKFGREYDLDIYMIVAVDSFNAGAMENKGLNIFNSALTLASAKTATDFDFMNIESVIAHEYFHNWTGNRITCRDWFQLTLKEGLTVYRDQEFSADMNSRGVQRIKDVQKLRQRQLPEDAGPLSHPIKPKSYMAIDNFYTPTIYEKGAEVIRMLETLLGKEGFRKGMDLYFKRHDESAVCTEDFVAAMADANNYNLEQFKRWYDQAGTPKVDASWSYDFSQGCFNLHLKQFPTSITDPLHIPIKFALILKDGKNINEITLELKTSEQSFQFKVEEGAVPSLNRAFGAPIVLSASYSEQELAHLMSFDQDPFNRYEAHQRYLKQLLKGRSDHLTEVYLDAFKEIVLDEQIDPLYKAELLAFPTLDSLLEGESELNIREIYTKLVTFKASVAARFHPQFFSIYEKHHSLIDGVDRAAIGSRALKNAALSYLSLQKTSEAEGLLKNQFLKATTMTDESAALELLVHHNYFFKDEAISLFYSKWSHETLVIQKLFRIVATAPGEKTLAAIKKLEMDPLYDKKVPNLVRSLITAFATTAHLLHDEKGEGYNFLAEKIIEIDTFNPSMSAKLCTAFHLYKKLPESQRLLMKSAMERVKSSSNLSVNALENISRMLI